MKKLYLIKLKARRVEGHRVWGLEGHKGPLSWADTVKLLADAIAKGGLAEVEHIRHYDKVPKNYGQLNGSEMLVLWKAVVSAGISTDHR